MDTTVLSTLLRILVAVILLAGLGVLLVLSMRPTRRRAGSSAAPSRPQPGIGSTIPDKGPEDLRIRSRLYYYAAHVTAVYDGDTLTVDVDLGLGIWRRNQTIRLWKVNTPEVSGPEREQGLRVRDFVRGRVLDKDILLRTILDKRGEDQTGKFGRLLGEILVEDKEGNIVNINDLLLQQGMALPMDEEGSTITTAPTARGLGKLPKAVACPYCGEIRRVDPTSRIVEACPNCLAQPYRLAVRGEITGTSPPQF
jgi:micrococcal nuclease